MFKYLVFDMETEELIAVGKTEEQALSDATDFIGVAPELYLDSAELVLFVGVELPLTITPKGARVVRGGQDMKKK